jgi:NACalpha-BTF3-like transcription factor
MTLDAAGADLKVALVMVKANTTREKAIAALASSESKVEPAVTLLKSEL